MEYFTVRKTNSVTVTPSPVVATVVDSLSIDVPSAAFDRLLVVSFDISYTRSGGNEPMWSRWGGVAMIDARAGSPLPGDVTTNRAAVCSCVPRLLASGSGVTIDVVHLAADSTDATTFGYRSLTIKAYPAVDSTYTGNV